MTALDPVVRAVVTLGWPNGAMSLIKERFAALALCRIWTTKPCASDRTLDRGGGTARVRVDDKVLQLPGENQSVYVPLGAVRRMENPGRVLIEVQTGPDLGEDDIIIRYVDIYALK